MRIPVPVFDTLSLLSPVPVVSCPAAPPTRGRNVWSILKRSLVLRRHIRYSWNVICARANNNRYNYSARDRSYSSCSEIMTDFQACADDHVDTSSSVTSACYICRRSLSLPKGRRTLDYFSEQNRKAVSFIERFVTEVPISTQQSIRLYLCKPCFSRVDKVRRPAEEAEKTILA